MFVLFIYLRFLIGSSLFCVDQCTQVVANCAINESFCYNKATTTFHQWRDIIDDRVFGVKFANINDAQLFGETVDKIVDSSEKIARLTATSSNNLSTMANQIDVVDDDDIRHHNHHYQQQQQFPLKM